ncbi:alpha/beta fold hydrolase [Bosea sp. (in: a-proteobacteria)]|uniref:alpha/beta fold hydrolase n=1 Tax=Bosea sp. (in: a-proteobacteria) TaxID=1871050 RepID=UPI00403362C2
MSDTVIKQTSVTRFIDAPNLFIGIGDTNFVYRDLGPRGGVPILMLNHWGAVLDNFDPRIVDGLATRHRVITASYRGMGATGGTAPVTVGEMARDAIAFVQALGLEKVDVLGFSMGGFVAQDIAMKTPGLVRKLILTGTGPAGGTGINKVGRVSWPLIVRGLLTRRDPKLYLFFTATENGRTAAKAFLQRLGERKEGRDREPAIGAFLRQLKAIKAWGNQAPQDLGRIGSPVLVANGDNDIMVPTANSHDMARRFPNAELVIYGDAGHGGIFQYHSDFVAKTLTFLAS